MNPESVTVIGYIRASTPQQRSTILTQYELIQRHCQTYGFTLPQDVRRTITLDDVQTVVAKMARIPPQKVSSSDKTALKDLDHRLKSVVFGQDAAIDALASAIKLSRSGLGSEEKPIGSFLFAGPTGVGKTEVAKQLASIMGIEFIRFDMSEYMERHTVSRLIGAPPGYVGFDQGGLLTDAVNKNPHAVLLFDEIEKAHGDLQNILLQVMDHGKLTDHNGKTVDFRNVILIMTTNAGASDLAKETIGFARDEGRKGEDGEAIKRLFTPEFRNRLDAIVAFAAAIIGGFHNLPGAIIGGFMIGILENLIGAFVATNAIRLTPFMVIMLVLLIRPQGLLGGKAQVKKV